MFTYLSSIHGSADLIFLVCAITGVTLFALRGLLMLSGSVFGDADDADHHHEDVEPTFKFLTLHTLTGFLMVFGLLGLGLRHQLDYPFGLTLGLALLAGCFMMLLVGAIFYGASHVTSHGTVFRIEEAIGLPAIVYQRITATEDGKVQVEVRGMTRELAAKAHEGAEIDSFVHVRVVAVVDEHTVVVEQFKV